MTMSVSDAITQANDFVSQGLQEHKLNNLIVARSLYNDALKLVSEHGDALHLLGMLNESEGDIGSAINLVQLAIKSDSGVALYHNNLGNLYFKNGNIDQALIYFQNALSIQPDYIEAKYNLANVMLEKNEFSTAEKIYLELLHSKPDFTPAIYNLIEIYLLNENYSDAYDYLKSSEVCSNDEGIKIKCREVIYLYLENTTDPDIKIELLRQITTFDSTNPDVKFNLANAYKQTGDITKAKQLYEEVLTIAPQYFGALVNLGVIDTWLGQFESAADNFETAYRINACDYTLLNNLGMVYQSLKNIERSTYFYEQAISFDNERPEAYWNYALLLLLIGEYEKGWQYYERRWDVPEQMLEEKRVYSQPVWQGETLENKILYIYCEQGFGDSIQFIRYLNAFKVEGVDAKNIVLECPKLLSRLIHFSFPEIKIVNADAKYREFDFQIALMSLPNIFKTRIENIPNDIPYLKTDQAHEKKWADLMCANQQEDKLTSKSLKVGIVWAGNPRKHNLVNSMIDQRRSCDLSGFSSILKIEGIKFYSLQKHDPDLDLLKLQDLSIKDCMKGVTDFYDTACIIQNLDLVISVDTAVAHLAAAIGKPVWLLSRYDGCWRWLLNRDDSPWYPDMKLFRQSRSGEWGDVFENVALALKKLIGV